MSDKDFKTTIKIFQVAATKIRNDETLGEWLIDLGASLVALGVQENHRVEVSE
jgi:hypothetical protein